MNKPERDQPIVSPPIPEPQAFADPDAAVARLVELYDSAVRFLTDNFSSTVGERPA